MENYILKTEFSNCTLIFKNFVSDDKYHISFTVNIKSFYFDIEYTFKEIVYWQLPFYKKENKVEIFDECNSDCKLNIDCKIIELIIANDVLSNDTKVKLSPSDNETFSDFLIEFNAFCETILKK